jgi:hypothetical protein
MATFDNPAVDADEAVEALRGLAHASRTFNDPGDTYRVLGSLSAALASLQQSLDQLADWHDRNTDRASDDDGDRKAGRRDALAASEYLRDAAGRVQQAHGALNEAFNHNGRIAWQPPATPAHRDDGRRQPGRLAPASAFGTDTAPSRSTDPLGR